MSITPVKRRNIDKMTWDLFHRTMSHLYINTTDYFLQSRVQTMIIPPKFQGQSTIIFENAVNLWAP